MPTLDPSLDEAREGAVPHTAGPADAGSFDPDAEAMRLAVKVIEKAQVARSFARIAAGVVQQSAKQASVVLRVYADAAIAQSTQVASQVATQVATQVAAQAVAQGGAEDESLRVAALHVEKARRFARAAAAAAAEVTAAEVARVVSTLDAVTQVAPRPRDARPPESGVSARAETTTDQAHAAAE